MIRIGTCAVPGEFTVDACATRRGTTPLFENNDRTAFCYDEPVTIKVEWARCVQRIVVPSRHCPCGREARDAEGGDSRVETAGDYHVGAPTSDRLGGLAYGVRACGTSRHR